MIMTNCKQLKIYRFNFSPRKAKYVEDHYSKEFTKWNLELHFNIDEYRKFLDSLLKKYTGKSIDEWDDIHFPNRREYDKIGIDHGKDLGFKYIKDNHNLQKCECWGYIYIGVPLSNPDLVAWFDSNVPNTIKIVKSI